MNSGQTTVKSASSEAKILRPEEAAVLDANLRGANALQAVKAAGLSMNAKNAEAYVAHIKNKYTDARGGLLVELDKVGVNLTKVAETIRDGLSAEKAVKVKISKELEDVIMVPDAMARHRFLETTIDVMGAKAPDQVVVEHIGTHDGVTKFVDDVRRNPELLNRIRERLQRRDIDVTPDEVTLSDD
jgi:hypothetical protein